MRKTVRKYKCGQGIKRSAKKELDDLALDEMFDKLMNFKKTEALPV